MLRDLLLYTLFMATILITINGHLNVNMEHEQMVSVEHELLGLEVSLMVVGEQVARSLGKSIGCFSRSC